MDSFSDASQVDLAHPVDYIMMVRLEISNFQRYLPAQINKSKNINLANKLNKIRFKRNFPKTKEPLVILAKTQNRNKPINEIPTKEP